MNSGLLALQVRSLAGLQQHPPHHHHHHQLPSPMSSSPDSVMVHSHTPSPIRSPVENNNNNSSRNFNSSVTHSTSDMSEDIDIEDVKPMQNKNNVSPNVVTF